MLCTTFWWRPFCCCYYKTKSFHFAQMPDEQRARAYIYGHCIRNDGAMMFRDTHFNCVPFHTRDACPTHSMQYNIHANICCVHVVYRVEQYWCQCTLRREHHYTFTFHTWPSRPVAFLVSSMSQRRFPIAGMYTSFNTGASVSGISVYYTVARKSTIQAYYIVRWCSCIYAIISHSIVLSTHQRL